MTARCGYLLANGMLRRTAPDRTIVDETHKLAEQSGMTLTYRIGQGLMALAALGAVAAFIGGVGHIADAPTDRLWIESWRTFGFMVFAGLFALLAWRPTRSPLIWELVFLHKAAMATTYWVAGSVPEASQAGPVDLVLCLMILIAWGLTGGWQSWRAQKGAGS
jgi:hypothetical protein